MSATEVASLRDSIYQRPSIRPGCDRAHDETWDLVDPGGYSVREIRPGQWHVVDGPGMCDWYCTGDCCLTWDDVVARWLPGGAS